MPHSHSFAPFKGTSNPLFQVNMKETFSHPEQTIITPLVSFVSLDEKNTQKVQH